MSETRFKSCIMCGGYNVKEVSNKDEIVIECPDCEQQISFERLI